MLRTTEYNELMAASEQARQRGSHIDGADLAQQAVDITRERPMSTEHAAALALAAVHFVRISESEKARQVAEQALAAFVELVDWSAASRVLCTLALTYENLSLHHQSLAHATEALSFARRSGDQVAECWALMRVCSAYENNGETSRGLEFGRDALKIAVEVNQLEELFMVRYNLSWAETCHARDLLDRGNDAAPVFASALEHATAALALALESGNVHRELLARNSQARLLADTGEADQAVRAMRTLSQRAAAMSIPGMAMLIEVELAHALDRSGHPQDALDVLDDVVTRLDPHANSDVILEATLSQYRVCRKLGRFEDALGHHERYHEMKLHRVEQITGAQARMLVNRLELDQARHEIEIERTRSELLHRAAHHDVLTGLSNRRAVDDQVPGMLDASVIHKHSMVAAIIDIDHFKVINDTFGHGIGDAVLVVLAEILRLNVRNEDLAARIGGEEFLLVLVNTAMRTAVEVCERIRHSVTSFAWQTISPGLAVSVSIGVDSARSADEMSTWLKRADDALYSAKRAGRDRVVATV